MPDPFPSSLVIEGAYFSGISAGIKPSGAPDLGAIVFPHGAHWVAAITTNSLKAAPLRHLEKLRKYQRPLRAIIVNSGNANACTGKEGELAVQRILAQARRILTGILPTPPRADEIIMASTGVIGVPLPVKKICDALPFLFRPEALSSHNVDAFARAIMTTDRSPKVCIRTLTLPRGVSSRSAKILGVAKGAGMIAPSMATMLAFVVTDLLPPRPLFSRIFQDALAESFHRITVDGEMSTNDLVLCAAVPNAQRAWDPSLKESFSQALTEVMQELALAIVRDGEGARSLVEVEIKGARTRREAEELARRVANSLLVKVALFGRDPNWGRIAAALGSTGIPLREEHLKITIGGVALFAGGRPRGKAAEERARNAMEKDRITIGIVVGKGPGEATFYTCDLGIPYVELNSSYRS